MNKADRTEMDAVDPVADRSEETARPARRPTRMTPEDRREMILDGAVHFFAKHGFRAQTRALSDELNVSQALIFRYFGSKKDLVEAVYQRNFMSRWRDDWEALLRDRSVPLRERLIRFYGDYLHAVDHHDWIRISVFSGLSGNQLTKRYIETQVDGLLSIIAEEVARETGARDDAAPSSDMAHERVWHLHSTFIYYLFRKYVFKTRATDNHDALVRVAVDNFLYGLPGDLSG